MALRSIIVTLLFSIYPKNCLRIIAKSSVLNAVPSVLIGRVINLSRLSESFVSSLVTNLSNSPLYGPLDALLSFAVLGSDHVIFCKRDVVASMRDCTKSFESFVLFYFLPTYTFP